MIAPVYLMENLFNPWNLASQREQQHHGWPVAPCRRMAGAQPGHEHRLALRFGCPGMISARSPETR
jgi:hypothetical protein